MTWSDDESALERALEVLQQRYPSETVEIISTFDIAHVGWEFDYQGALITHDGVPELVIVDQTSGDDRSVREILEAKLDEYELLIERTKHVLAQHMVLEGLSRRVIGVEELSDQEMSLIMESTVEHTVTGAANFAEIAEMMIASASLDEILAAHPGADIDAVMGWHAEMHGDDLSNTYAARQWLRQKGR